MLTKPEISVLMSVYNGELYLAKAIESILNQSFSDFEFIIIDDGSTDNSPKVINSYSDRRIVRLKNNTNSGLIKALNHGLEIARGKYIARIDADDLSLPLRLRQQILYLNQHPEIGLLGTWVEQIDEEDRHLSFFQPPTSDVLITWGFIFHNCLTHSSVMFRRQLLEQTGGYSEAAYPAADYDLWVRMSRITRLANLPEVLVRRRVHKDTAEARLPQKQNEARIKTLKQVISELLKRQISEEDIFSIERINQRLPFNCAPEIKLAIKLIEELLKSFLSQRPLYRQEKNEVYLDAINKIWSIGRGNAVNFPKAARQAYFRSFNLNPQAFIHFLGPRLLKKYYKDFK